MRLFSFTRKLAALFLAALLLLPTIFALQILAEETSPCGIAYDAVVWSEDGASPLGSASRFNGLIFGDCSDIIDVEGALAVNGDFVSSRGFSVGFGRGGSKTDVPLSTKDIRLLVGGDIQITGHLSVYGHTLSGGETVSNGCSYTVGKNSDATAQIATLNNLYRTKANSSINDNGSSLLVSAWNGTSVALSEEKTGADTSAFFHQARQSLNTASQSLALIRANGTVAENDQTYVLTGTDAVNYYTLDFQTTDTLRKSLVISAPENSINIVTILTGSSLTLAGGCTWGNSEKACSTLFNLPSATTLTFTDSPVVYGSFLAPSTALRIACTGGNINGTAVLASLTGRNDSGFELHRYPFIGLSKTNPQKTSITITKRGEHFASVTNHEGFYTPVYSETALEGAVYKVYAAENIYGVGSTLLLAEGVLADVVCTGKDGKATTRSLYPGKYRIIEYTAPYGMVRSTKEINVSISPANNIPTADFTDVRQKLCVDLNKVMEEDTLFGVGKQSDAVHVRFGLYAAEDIVASDGSKIPKDGLIEIISPDSTGYGVFTADLPHGNYYVREVETAEGYLTDDTVYDVPFPYTDQDLPVFRWTVNKNNDLHNILLRGSILGYKSDGNGHALPNALFGVFAPGTTKFTAENALAVATSDENGYFSMTGIPYGDWQIAEIQPPDGYVLLQSAFPVTVNQNGVTIPLEIENERICGEVKVIKADAVNGALLTKAVFEVWLDRDENNILDPATDLFFGNMTDHDDGTYTLKNLPYGNYFLLEARAPEHYTACADIFPFNIRVSGDSILISTDESGKFLNDRQSGKLKIIKSSEDGVLEGFSFRVEGTSVYGTPYCQDFLTDVHGEILISDLEIGSYTVRETDNERSEKYLLPEEQILIVADGVMTVGRFYNELIKGGFEIKKIDAVTGRSVAGCWFHIFDSHSTLVFSGASNQDGYLSATLRPGEYTAVEYAVPDGYELNDTPYPFTVTESDELTFFIVENQPTDDPPVPPTGDDESSAGWLWVCLCLGMLCICVGSAIWFIARKEK